MALSSNFKVSDIPSTNLCCDDTGPIRITPDELSRPLCWTGGGGYYSANHTAQTHAARKATLPPHTCTLCSKDKSKGNQFNDSMLWEVVVPPTMAR